MDENDVQGFLHKLEGKWRGGLQLLLLPAAVMAVATFFIWKFHGLSSAEGMEQAQIARELARGNGFSTKVIRPLGIWEFQSHNRTFPAGNIPDVFHAPLNPLINSFFLRLDRASWRMTGQQTIYPPDLLIAEVAMAFFALALAVNYLTARLLFGDMIAAAGTGLAIACNAFWQFALSGLPQMLMLFLFSACLYALARAMDARLANASAARWLAGAGALFGLLGLAHGLTIWIFAGALVYAGVAFRPRGRQALLMLLTFSLVYAPWLVRNWRVCGNPFGLAGFSALGGITVSGDFLMRSLTLGTLVISTPSTLAKLDTQAVFQLNHLYALLGASPLAPLFLVALLHRFRRPQAADFRWGLAYMGLGAVAGMTVFGLEATEDLAASDLYILFVPLFIFYGLAFILSLWRRLMAEGPSYRTHLLVALYFLSAIPILGAGRGRSIFHWPPYAPPSISVLNKWTTDDEITASDIPWGVAWYADRKCLWLPLTIKEFTDMDQSRLLGHPLVGIYLTPVSCDAPYYSGILYGDNKDWVPLILIHGKERPLNLPANFPLHAAIRLPFNRECIYYSDRNRWSEPGD